MTEIEDGCRLILLNPLPARSVLPDAGCRQPRAWVELRVSADATPAHAARAECFKRRHCHANWQRGHSLVIVGGAGRGCSQLDGSSVTLRKVGGRSVLPQFARRSAESPAKALVGIGRHGSGGMILHGGRVSPVALVACRAAGLASAGPCRDGDRSGFMAALRCFCVRLVFELVDGAFGGRDVAALAEIDGLVDRSRFP